MHHSSSWATAVVTAYWPEAHASNRSFILRVRGLVPTNSGFGASGAAGLGVPRHLALFEIVYSFGLNAQVTFAPPAVERMDAFTGVIRR